MNEKIKIKPGSRVKVHGFGSDDLFAKVNKVKGTHVSCNVYRNREKLTLDIPIGSITDVVRY